MNNIRLFIGLFSVLLFLFGCGGNEMTIVKAHPKMVTENTKISDERWKRSYNEGLTYYNNKEYSAAMELFAVALKYTGDDDETRAWLYFSIGRCWESLQDLSKAEQNYIMAQNLDPHLSEASDGLARITKRRAEGN